MEKHVLVIKMFAKELSMGRKKHIDSLVKNKFLAQQSVKMLIVFWDIKGPITIDFLEKGTTVNNAFSFQLPWQNSPYLLNDLLYLCTDFKTGDELLFIGKEVLWLSAP